MILSSEVWILVVSAFVSLANAEIPSDNDDEGMLSGLATEKRQCILRTLKTKSPRFLCASKALNAFLLDFHLSRMASCYKIFVNPDTFLPVSSLPCSFSAK